MILNSAKEVLKYLNQIYKSSRSSKSVNRFYGFNKSSISNLNQLIQLPEFELDEKLDNLDSLYGDDFAEWILTLVDSYTEDVAVEIIDKIIS